MRYLLLMTLAGSILFGLYWVWMKMLGSHVSYRMKYAALVVVLLLHVTPLMWLRNAYLIVLEHLPLNRTTSQLDLLVDMADISTASEFYITPNFRWTILMAVIWTSCSVLAILRTGFIYFRKRRDLNKVSVACHSETGARIVERLRPEFHTKRPINVIQVEGKGTPYTIGVFHPVIVLQGEFTDGEMEWALRHEMSHIVRGDIVIKLLLELVCGLYWFNLTLYFFRKHLDKVCESACDERVMCGRTKEERDAYTALLSKYKNSTEKVPFGNALSDNNKNIDERIEIIMNIRKMKRWEKIVAASVFAVFLLADSLVALAYPDVYHVEDSVDSAEKVAVGNSFWTFDFTENGYESLIFEVIYDAEFIDKTGNIIPVGGEQPNVFCLSHNWVEGYLQTHTVNSNGSCTVDVYNSKRCTRCNTITVDSLYVSMNYPVCPH